MLAAPPMILLPVRYRIRTRLPDGSAGDIPADGKVAAGAGAFFEVTAVADGNLQIAQQNRTIDQRAVQANKTVEIPLPRAQGRQQFQLVFTETSPNAKPQAGPAPAPFRATITLDFQ